MAEFSILLSREGSIEILKKAHLEQLRLNPCYNPWQCFRLDSSPVSPGLEHGVKATGFSAATTRDRPSPRVAQLGRQPLRMRSSSSGPTAHEQSQFLSQCACPAPVTSSPCKNVDFLGNSFKRLNHIYFLHFRYVSFFAMIVWGLC